MELYISFVMAAWLVGGKPAALLPASSLSSGLGDLLFNWPLLSLAILLGVGIYIAGMLLYYALFYDDVLEVQREDLPVHALMRLVNPVREALGKLPLWEVPQDVEEKEMVRVAIDCLWHVQRGLDRYGSSLGRAASNARTLKQLARRLMANMVEALWSLQWARDISVKLSRIDGHDSSNRLLRVRQIERRDLCRVRRSFDSLIALATELAELGSQVKESDVERLLGEFRELLMQFEEDTLALEEVRRDALSSSRKGA